MNAHVTATLAVPVGKQDHVRGPLTAPVTLVEYGDYECPHCGHAHVVVQQLEQLMSDAFRFVFRHFPLTTVHPHAAQAAEAAEAASAQEVFWQMHDRLFENQDALSEGHLIRYATMIGMDVTRFAREMAERRYAPRVREDFLSGVRSGVNGTPTFFINGVRHDGPSDLAALLAGIEYAAETE